MYDRIKMMKFKGIGITGKGVFGATKGTMQRNWNRIITGTKR
jgi:hypothetical protein